VTSISRAILPFFALVFLPACYTAQKKNLLTEEFRSDPATVPLALSAVVVVDSRSGIESRPLKIHYTSTKTVDAVQPPLTAQHRALIESELARYFTPGQRPVRVTAEMTKGEKFFEGSSMRAVERSEVEFKLTFMDGPTGRLLFQGWGTAKPEVESSSGSQEYSDALFSRAIEISLYAAMRRVRMDMDSGVLRVK
jgi:hypothetical protein